MESHGFITSDKKMDFRQIVLFHLKKILEISNKELADLSYEEVRPNSVVIIHKEDTRRSYIQSIENLAYILLPYFDNKIKEVYKKCIKVINFYGYEIRKEFKKELEEIKKESGKEGEKELYIEFKIKYAKELFCALNLLLKRNDYLKSQVYGEEEDITDTDE